MGGRGKAALAYKHGHSVDGRQSPTLKSWWHMLDRCLKPSDPKYPIYGGRGIVVCERWLDFQSFLEDMGEKPAGMTLGRINNDGDYEPKNCRWETPLQQSNNTRQCYKLQFKGKIYSGAQLARMFGVPGNLFRERIRRGYTIKQAAYVGRYKTGPKKGVRCRR
jgi:hypothetical protein